MSSPKLSAHTETCVLQLLEAAASLERQLDRILSNTRGISYSEYRLLSALADSGEGGLPRIELANEVGLTASAITRALKPLEKLGYISTAKGARDARQSRASITSGGQRLLSDARVAVLDLLASLPLNGLNASQADQLQQHIAALNVAK